VNPDRIVVDTWDPIYAAPLDLDDELDAPPVDLDVEHNESEWAPLPQPDVAAPQEVLFVDGVQRVDARITLIDRDQAIAGIAGSFAAGTVRHTPGRATIENVEVRRGLFTRASDITLDCGPGVVYSPYATPDTTIDALARVMTDQMRALEKVLATDAAADLVIIDGPLSGARYATTAVGVIKTHRRSYLPERLQTVVARLDAGHRTPLFLTATNYSRYSWYLQLPGPGTHPWAGVVRCEASGELPLTTARDLANCAQATLPRFASIPHRDPRAPQNLTPIGELERRLRHRLGDPAILERMLRRTCATWRVSQEQGASNA
jgi:hypothetical protein